MELCRCGHPEEAHEVREYRGDKGRRCVVHLTPGYASVPRCGCTNFAPPTRQDRLIAAGEELLQQLQHYIDLLEDYDAGVPITDPAHNHHEPWTEAKALLARIEGSKQ